MNQSRLLMLVSLTVAGCANVRIESPSGEIRLEQRWGILSVVVDSPTTNYVAEIRSLGITSTPMGWSAGITRQNWASLGPDCQLVIWVSEAEHLEAAKRLEASIKGVCIANPNNR